MNNEKPTKHLNVVETKVIGTARVVLHVAEHTLVQLYPGAGAPITTVTFHVASPYLCRCCEQALQIQVNIEKSVNSV